MSVLNRLGFGCVALSTLATPRMSRNLLEGVFESGIRHFDTAPAYGQGYSERLVGEFLRGKRDRVSVATKFGLGPKRPPRFSLGLAMRLNALRRRVRRLPVAALSSEPARLPAPPTPSRRIGRVELERAFDSSCRSLGTDYVDLYLLHENLPSSLEAGALDFLLELRESGRVRRLGLAASGSRYFGLGSVELAEWDVLQYEFGLTWPAHYDLLGLFPAKTHIFHSCLKGIADTAKTPGQVLAGCLSANPSGMILFSSSKLAHVRENLRTLEA